MDECKALLEAMLAELVTIKEGNVYILAELIMIRSALGGK